ncbi:hypothetical protein E2A64_06325 [Pseudohoeflea suaedae]|uniref:DUF2134 domain-containing protein n=1 Tax=Pseudohoeflea suaedae TaxID=877384 RepID=A0A4R5PNS2_9HYPH|nr:TadG family pilus assembly protein [Pseudohoeflea suaedae]TDH38710.1 hypothetical protein E2A64_06325 [Pseudohoeflea suaedae]
MTPFLKPFSRVSEDRSGSIAVPAAASLMLIVGTLALGVDYGAITLQNRRAQAMVDIMAIQAASDIGKPEEMVRRYLQDNDLDYAISLGNGYLLPDGSIVGEEEMKQRKDGLIEIETGSYMPDPSLQVSDRFVPAGPAEPDAVRVKARQKAELYFASVLTDPFDFEVTGTASATKQASFWIGSRLASLDGGILNKITSGLLGTELSLSVMDYNALASVDLDLLSFSKALATDVSLQAGTFNDLLASDVSLPKMLSAMRATQGVSGAAESALASIERAIGNTDAKIQLGDLIDLGAIGDDQIGSQQSLEVHGNLLQLVTAASALSKQGRQVAIDLGTVVPGLGRTTARLAIGEPPAHSSMIATGSLGDAVRTAQMRLLIDTELSGLLALLGTKIHLPIFVETAFAEARLRSISCGTSYVGDAVKLDVTPGLAKIAVAQLDASKFDDFSRPLSLQKAKLVTTPLLEISGIADVSVSNTSARTITFSGSSIHNHEVRNVSTRNFIGSLVGSLAEKTRLEARVLGLSLVSPDVVLSLVGQLLKDAAAPLDNVLYNTLLAFGVKVGEADVSVTDVDCGRPVLVQ